MVFMLSIFPGRGLALGVFIGVALGPCECPADTFLVFGLVFSPVFHVGRVSVAFALFESASGRFVCLIFCVCFR